MDGIMKWHNLQQFCAVAWIYDAYIFFAVSQIPLYFYAMCGL